ncbi:MAG: DUF935 family protein [Candidatus Kapabacteria bacterium]|nr:DUF935 family protein [Ignavibacteriota bacterium]MCW5885031.1 DUF935 family protein [Candidatus Kapabacteria bacterium]
MKYLTDELVKSSNLQSFVNRIGILPNPDKILRKSGHTYQVLRDLRNDSHVWSCLQSRKSGTLNLDYFIDSNNSEQKVMDFIEKTLAGINLNRIISEILDAPYFGFQVHEIIWQNDKSNPAKLTLKDIALRPQEIFAFDTNGKLIFKPVFGKESKLVPEYKFLLTTFEADLLNPYGNSLLSKCYWNVTFKNSCIRFWVNYMEKYGMPLLIGQYNRGATQAESEKLAEALAEMTEDTVIVTPMDINIDIKEAARNSSVELYREMINHCNAEISKTILSETLTTELHSGSFAAAQTHFRVRREVIAADTKIVENTINELIDYIVKINFGETISPCFKFVINDSDNLNKIDRDIKLVNAGVKFTKDYWMRTYGLSADDFDLNQQVNSID